MAGFWVFTEVRVAEKRPVRFHLNDADIVRRQPGAIEQSRSSSVEMSGLKIIPATAPHMLCGVCRTRYGRPADSSVSDIHTSAARNFEAVWLAEGIGEHVVTPNTPFPQPFLSPHRILPRRSGRLCLTKAKTSCTIDLLASLRSE
jgi:hypothetical protein